jgi:hypothetical protein
VKRHEHPQKPGTADGGSICRASYRNFGHPERTVLYRVLFYHFERFVAEYEGLVLAKWVNYSNRRKGDIGEGARRVREGCNRNAIVRGSTGLSAPKTGIQDMKKYCLGLIEVGWRRKAPGML